jgi:hypothetical protein
VVECFSAQVMARNTEAVYRELLDE